MRPLAGNGANAAGRGMEQHGLASLQRVSLTQQILTGQALSMTAAACS